LLASVGAHAAWWYSRDRGRVAQWTYEAVERLALSLTTVFIDKIRSGGIGSETAAVRGAFLSVMFELHHREFQPYPYCARVCDQGPLCLYRPAMTKLAGGSRYRRWWLDADIEDARKAPQSRTATWRICRSASYEALESSSGLVDPAARARIVAAARRASLCFQQQMLATDERKVLPTVDSVMQSMLAEPTKEGHPSRSSSDSPVDTP